MSWSVAKWAGLLTVIATAGIASAEGPPPYPTQGPCASPPGLPSGMGIDGQPFPGAPSGAAPQGAPGAAANQGAPGAATDQGSGAAPQGAPAAATDQGGPEGSSLPTGLGRSRSGFSAGSVPAAGTGLASAAGGGPTVGPVMETITFLQFPLILPGLFTALQPENALPIDRVFVDYGYFDSFRVVKQAFTPTGFSTADQSTPFGAPFSKTQTTQAGFNLNRFNIGVEKTFLDGRASIYVRVPVLDATNNTSALSIDGLGDVSAGLKCVMLADKKTGSVLTAGMTVSAPTARDQVLVTSAANVSGENFMPLLTSTSTITVNPTFLQPWFAGLLVLDRLYIQDYLGFVVPTDTRVPPILNNDFGVGYQVYRSSPGRFLRSVTPTIDVQVVQPFNERSGSGSVPNSIGTPLGFTSTTAVPAPAFNGVFGFPTQVFMSEGMQFGLGDRSLLSAAVVTPLAGPKAFTIGATVGINFFF